MKLIKKYHHWRINRELKKLTADIEHARRQAGRYSTMDPNTVDILMWGKMARIEELEKQVEQLKENRV